MMQNDEKETQESKSSQETEEVTAGVTDTELIINPKAEPTYIQMETLFNFNPRFRSTWDLGRWNEHNLDGVPTPVTATIFHALSPEEIDKLDLSDPALVDRTHLLYCLPLHGHTIGDGLFDPYTDQARQAMLALLVQHAAANPEPPDGPASVTRLLRERWRASIGSVGRWLVDHLQVTGDGDEIIFADEIMAALAEDIPPDAQAQFQGRTRREILHLARGLIQGFPTARQVHRGERLLSAYPGVRLLKTADIHTAGAARRSRSRY